MPGRLTFYARMGADHVADLLPPLLRAVRDEGHPVVWASDPMHANTIRTASGVKTRRFDTIMRELEGFFAACWQENVWPGGVHLEFTGEDVTECLGGADDVVEEQLSTRYETLLDPRLNARQSLDLAFRLAELMRARASRTLVPKCSPRRVRSWTAGCCAHPHLTTRGAVVRSRPCPALEGDGHGRGPWCGRAKSLTP